MDRILAAGGLVWRDRAHTELLVVHRSRYDDWSLPKGKLDDGETFVGAALREVNEETGCSVALESWAGETFYRVGERTKSVLFWNMLAAPGALPMAIDTGEVAEAKWLRVADALALLNYADEKALVERNAQR